jgi:hypothetical protein
MSTKPFAGKITRWLLVALAVFVLLTAILTARLQARQNEPPPRLPPGVEITIKAQPLKATIGDRIQIDLDFTLPQGYQLQFPSLPEQFGEFTILETLPGPILPLAPAGGKLPAAPEPAAAQKPGTLHHQARIVAAAYRTGEFDFPAVPITLRDSEGRQIEVATPTVKIEIASVLDEKDLNLRDLKKQADIEEAIRWLLWITLGVLATALILLAWWWIRRRRRPVFLPSVLPDVDPLDLAEAELRELLRIDLLEKGIVKPFYVRLSEIMKKALEASYGIQTVEKTTSEIVAALANPTENGTSVPEPASLELVETLLLSCDMVKFARYVPSRAETDEAVQRAFQILLECRARRQPAVSAAAPGTGVA